MLATDTLFYKHKNKERVYYKEVYSEWTQPVFNANNFNHASGNYVLTASHQSNPAWYAFNASNKGNNCWWTNHGTATETNFCWICFYSTKKMKFNSITIKNEVESPVNFKTGVLQGSQDGKTWTDLCVLTGQNTTALEMTFNFENDTGYYYYRCYFTASFGAGVAIQWMKFYGTQHTNTVVSTVTDYDYYEEYPVFKVPEIEKTTNIFWKIRYKTWNYARPKLSNNTGNSELKVSASSQYDSSYPPYKSFASTSGDTPWISKDRATTAWYQMEFPRPFRITSVFMRNRSSKYDLGAAIAFIFQASDDGTTWEDITPTITNTVRGSGATWTFYTNALKGYKFYRFNITKVAGAYISIGFPTFYGEEEYVDTGSPIDYSYIETVTGTQKGAVTEPRLAYFKRGTEPNIVRSDTTGTAVIEDGVIKNINAASRIRLPKYPQGVTSYEIQLKFKIGSFNDGRLIGNYKTNVRSPQIEVPEDTTQDSATALWFGHPGASDTWTPNLLDAVLELNKDYWLRAIWTGVATYLMLSEDGVNFSIKANNASSACYWTEEFQFGVDVDGYATGTGTEIDLKESYVKINGEMWWRGTYPVECSEEEAEWSEWVNIDKPIN